LLLRANSNFWFFVFRKYCHLLSGIGAVEITVSPSKSRIFSGSHLFSRQIASNVWIKTTCAHDRWKYLRNAAKKDMTVKTQKKGAPVELLSLDRAKNIPSDPPAKRNKRHLLSAIIRGAKP
jgi:hypothetical protein